MATQRAAVTMEASVMALLELKSRSCMYGQLFAILCTVKTSK